MLSPGTDTANEVPTSEELWLTAMDIPKKGLSTLHHLMDRGH